MLSIKYIFNLYCISKNKKFYLCMHIDCKNKSKFAINYILFFQFEKNLFLGITLKNVSNIINIIFLPYASFHINFHINFLSLFRTFADLEMRWVLPSCLSLSSHSPTSTSNTHRGMTVFGYLSGIHVIARTRASSLWKSTYVTLSFSLLPSSPSDFFPLPFVPYICLAATCAYLLFNHPSKHSGLNSSLTRLMMQQIVIISCKLSTLGGISSGISTAKHHIT